MPLGDSSTCIETRHLLQKISQISLPVFVLYWICYINTHKHIICLNKRWPHNVVTSTSRVNNDHHCHEKKIVCHFMSSSRRSFESVSVQKKVVFTYSPVSLVFYHTHVNHCVCSPFYSDEWKSFFRIICIFFNTHCLSLYQYVCSNASIYINQKDKELSPIHFIEWLIYVVFLRFSIQFFPQIWG